MAKFIVSIVVIVAVLVLVWVKYLNKKNTVTDSNSDHKTIVKYVCKRCDHTVNDDDIYCRNCGEIRPTQRKCSNCSSKLQEKDRYCGKCGAMN